MMLARITKHRGAEAINGSIHIKLIPRGRPGALRHFGDGKGFPTGRVSFLEVCNLEDAGIALLFLRPGNPLRYLGVQSELIWRGCEQEQLTHFKLSEQRGSNTCNGR